MKKLTTGCRKIDPVDAIAEPVMAAAAAVGSAAVSFTAFWAACCALLFASDSSTTKNPVICVAMAVLTESAIVHSASSALAPLVQSPKLIPDNPKHYR